MSPGLIVHCDWSTDANKRWAAHAERIGDEAYRIDSPSPVGALDDFFIRQRKRAPTGSILTGFDFPIGLPLAYAERLGIHRFLDVLRQFGEGEWADFYRPADRPEEISLKRPFYPRGSGEKGEHRKHHLVTALGLKTAQDLLRVCDRKTQARAAACEIFWTLGAKQVGKAAICGWRELLAPALKSEEVRIWPFEGELASLLESESIVVAETYPAETYGHLGFSGNAKTRPEWRRANAPHIFSWCKGRSAGLSPELISEIESGFGSAPTGEDRFDSFIGLLGMIESLQDGAGIVLSDSTVRSIEGWILGMRTEKLNLSTTVVPTRKPAMEDESFMDSYAMDSSNNEKVGRALELVRLGLRPFVEQRLRSAYGDNWLREASRGLPPWQTAKAGPINFDVQALLGIMVERWSSVFGAVLGKLERSLIGELQVMRNGYAHQESFSDRDTHRALDTAERLLSAVCSPEAEKVRLLSEVLPNERIRTERLVDSSPMAVNTNPVANHSARSVSDEHAKVCPACQTKTFARWPWGWDGHAAHACRGITGTDPAERKRIYKERYL
jgi:hypothetical protein